MWKVTVELAAATDDGRASRDSSPLSRQPVIQKHAFGTDFRRSLLMARFQALLLPGGIMPAEFAYPDLVASLGPDVDARNKEHELYASDEPPPGYGLDTEVRGIRRFADEAGFDRF